MVACSSGFGRNGSGFHYEILRNSRVGKPPGGESARWCVRRGESVADRGEIAVVRSPSDEIAGNVMKYQGSVIHFKEHQGAVSQNQSSL